MKQTNRTEEIEAILKKIDAHFPDELTGTLEAYISQLEDNQKDLQLEETPVWDVDNPPIWSQARVEKRAQRRRERAAKKLNNYQSIKPL